MELYANNAHGTLASGITSGASSLTLDTGQGALFPNPTQGDFFRITIIKADLSAREIVFCTARSSDTLTILRAQEGTSATAFSTGDRVRMRPTAGMLAAIESQLAAEDQFVFHGAGHGAGQNSEWGVAFNESGTLSNPTLANTNHKASVWRRVATTANTTTPAGIQFTTYSRVWRGNGSALGGFDVEFDFGIEAHPTTMSMFAGITSTTAFFFSGTTGFTQPSDATSAHFIGVGFDLSSAGAEYKIWRNDGTGTPTSTATGINSNTTDWLRLRLYADPNASGINIVLTNRTSGVIWTATATSDLPGNTQFLLPQVLVRTTVSTGGAIAHLGCRQRRVPV